MTKITESQLQKFTIDFDKNIVNPLLEAGFERNKFNVFDILNIKNQELKHSDFLAFMFDPKRSGEVGAQFLHAFILIIAKEFPLLQLNIEDAENIYFDNVRVKREYKNIDILVEFSVSDINIVIAIENKINSAERFYNDKPFKSQLEKYKNIIYNEYKNYTPILLLLSPDNIKPSDNAWIAIDYKLIYTALNKVEIKNADKTLTILIRDYKNLLRSKFKMEIDEKIRAAALKIYNENADIFDEIYKCLPNRIEETAKFIRFYLSKLDWIKIQSERQNTFIAFTINDIEKERKDLQIFFQINVNDLTVYAYLFGGSKQDRLKLKTSEKSVNPTLAKYEYLVNNNKDLTYETIERIDKLLLNGKNDEVNCILKDLLDSLFSQNGYVKKHSHRILSLLTDN